MTVKEPSQKIIVIKGTGLGKSMISHGLAHWYETEKIPYRQIFARETNVERELKKLRDFIGFVLIDTPYDDCPVVPWQTIEITGGGFITPADYQNLPL